ncbi:peptidase S10, serine carboxypeptidase [Myriangium duriaei CBS 260.36]|uniref:Carboxypeptidase n=1 Tax=Myriangium duriaei CBS 260.36 TaxID=1168546 RepID=A0A9P4MLA5_9PEZI|nr:peptidase S10, serine carboxypeptidase [Myriangium duriaei CBS 260.36]
MGGNLKKPFVKRQFPASNTGATTILTPNNYTVSYKDTGKAGICETTPGVGSYAGYVDLAPDVHVFFWFFESRRDPKNDPITLWLNGGPGSDSLIGLFEELGPCNVTEDIKAQVNPYSFNEVSNLLFISQPVGVGFSYGEKALGSLNPVTGSFQDASQAPANGRYPVIDAVKVDTTDLAAQAVWEVLQGFLGALPQLDNKVGIKDFNLFTESYGGHYGPAFFNYFYDQNQAIQNGSTNGTQLNFNSLGVINGIIDEATQAPYYPEFAVHNTYGIESVNQTVYDYMKFALNMPNGCLAQVAGCRAARDTGLLNQATDSLCQEAEDMCRDNVEGPYYSFGGRGVYDIRHPYNDPTPPSYYEQYVMLPEVQTALGVDLNYTTSNNDIYFAFQSTGDFIFDNFIKDLEHLLNEGVRVSLIYGDADYICNWFGGQAVSLAVNYTHKAEFSQAGYTPMTVDGAEYGEVRQYGNFSFTRVYEAGHEVPYYQPVAALALFNRTINHFDIATGLQAVTADYETKGNATATHTESFVPLPSSTASATPAPLIRGPIIPRKANMRVRI